MGKLIRRTLTITLTESWTFVWIPGQTNDCQDGDEENATVLTSVELAQALSKLLGLSPPMTNQPDRPIQIFVQSLAKEAIDEDTKP